MKVLITGADGFIGRNIKAHLAERNDIDVLSFTRENKSDDLWAMIKEASFVFHLAGVNRTENEGDFNKDNRDFTLFLCEVLSTLDKKIPILYASSTQAVLVNQYGKSKLEAEEILCDFSEINHSPVSIYRLPNVFGKWAKPNYNSVVATFCHNIAFDLPIQINNAETELSLVYIDDVVAEFVKAMDCKLEFSSVFSTVEPVYNSTVGELATKIRAFRESRDTLMVGGVSNGFIRALYATYMSYLPPEQFSYDLKKHIDSRGIFVEMLKTKESGQISFFTAHAGVTRGGHYHHSKTEKFLVIKGSAKFRFRHVVSGEYYEEFTSGDKPEIVETVPGWTHDITNVGHDEMIVLLWANEVFDKNFPDTYSCEITQ